jgi:uncharacterized membrane protein YoaK (UPF0700 family)
MPRLLLALTVVTGIVDAFSFVVLGHIFVANMTGNVVSIGFALAGVGSVSLGASVLALAAFVVGALIAGRVAAPRLGRALLPAACAAQAVMVATAALVATASGVRPPTVRMVLVALAAVPWGRRTPRRAGRPYRSFRRPY